MRLGKSDRIELLQDVPLFAGCSKRELGKIAGITTETSVRPGACLIREGGRDREFLVIVDGAVKVTRGGRKLKDLGTGDWVGEIALLCDVPRTATVLATAPTRLLVLGDRPFRRLVRESPSIATKVMATLAERLADKAV